MAIRHLLEILGKFHLLCELHFVLPFLSEPLPNERSNRSAMSAGSTWRPLMVHSNRFAPTSMLLSRDSLQIGILMGFVHNGNVII